MSAPITYSLLKETGWTLEKFRCFKKVGTKEIDIEFCIGDFCLGIYDERLDLIEPKQRCKDFMEAFVKSLVLEDKYSKKDEGVKKNAS